MPYAQARRPNLTNVRNVTNVRRRSRGLRGIGLGDEQCMSMDTIRAAIGGMSNCSDYDEACIACNQQKSVALNNFADGGCIPPGTPISFTCDTSSAAVAAMMSNQPVENNAIVNGQVDTGVPTYVPNPSNPTAAPLNYAPGAYSVPVQVSAPAPAPTVVSSSAPPASATSMPTDVYAPGTPAVSGSASPTQSIPGDFTSQTPANWFTEASFGGVPNWALVGGGVLVLFLVMGGKH